MIQLVKRSLYIAVAAVEAYTILYSEQKGLMAIASLSQGIRLIHTQHL